MNFKEFPYQKWKASNNNLHPRTCLIHYAEVLEGRIYKGPHLGDSAIRFLVFFFDFCGAANWFQGHLLKKEHKEV